MPFTRPFSPDTIRWRRAAIVELRKLGIDIEHLGLEHRSPPTFVSRESAELGVLPSQPRPCLPGEFRREDLPSELPG